MRRRSTLARIAAIFLVLSGGALRASAQHVPDRSELAVRDSNDWEAYYDYAVDQLKVRQAQSAEAAFYWASRLAPQRAEPLYGRYVAFFMRYPYRLSDYLMDNVRARDRAEVGRADSLFNQALLRNPFVFQGLFVLALNELPGDWSDDPVTTGWLAYGRLDFGVAAEQWAVALRHKPRKRGWLRYYRALAFVGMERYDSAQAELTTMLADLRAREAEHTTLGWESHAFYEYAIALLQMARHDPQGATDELQKVLLDDLGFYHARIMLAQLDLQLGHSADALKEYAQAVELSPEDIVAHYEYGIALSGEGKLSDAETQLRAVIAREPYYADPYLSLGDVLDRRGERRGALAALNDYIARAPRTAPSLSQARQRVDQLTRLIAQDTTR